MMQTVSDDPLFWQLMGVKYILAETRPEGYELYRDYGDFQFIVPYPQRRLPT